MAKAVIPDIFHGNTVLDWGKVSAFAPFVIIKATQRCDFVDSKLKTTIEKCRKHNIPYWVYSYLEKGDDKYHVDQVKFLIETIRDLGILGNADVASDKYFVGWVLDIENGNSESGALAAVKYLLANGGNYKSMLYTSYRDYNRYKKAIEYICKKSGGTWWEARYGRNTSTYNPFYPPHKGCALHQYTERGKFNWIKGNVDLNRLTGVKELSWFLSVDEPKTSVVVKEKAYKGKKAKFPPRGYFKKGDGYLTLTSNPWRMEIESIQDAVRWVADRYYVPLYRGHYDADTASAVKHIQKILGVKVDGLYGPKTQKALFKYRKKTTYLI